MANIIFISTMAASSWGGSEELWSQAAIRLAGEGHQITASVTHWPELSPRVTALESHGIHVHVRAPEPIPSRASRLWRRISRRKYISQEQKNIAWLQSQKPHSVIIAQGGSTDGREWMEVCIKAGIPFFTIVQANHEGWWPSDGDHIGTLLREAQKVLCVSRRNLELLEIQIGESLPRAQVIWNPYKVSTTFTPPWPEENGICKIACVARLEPVAKGQDILLQVMALPNWRDRSIEVNFYGTGPYEQILKKLAERFQLSNVRFRGYVTDVEEIWKENSLLVLPSRIEGLPLALVEAMWSGRPAVVTDIGGNEEACVDGETGFVAAAPTVKFMAETMERAWINRHSWKAMGEAARKRAESIVPRDPIGEFCRLII